MGCCGQHIDSVHRSPGCWPSVNGIIECVKDHNSMPVGILIVIAIFRRVIDKVILQLLIILKIILHSILQLLP